MTTRALGEAGWTPSAQRHAVRVGDLERLRRGVVDLSTPADPSSGRRAVEASDALRVGRAAALACPRAVLSHACAATALGIPTVGQVSRPCLTVRAGTALRTLSRFRMTVNGIAAPRPQPSSCDEYCRYLGRCDFYFDEFGVVGEADGKLKYRPEVAAVAIIEERQRHQELEATGLIVVRWGWADLYEFGAVKQRLETAFRRGARRGSPERRWGILRPSGRQNPFGARASKPLYP